MHDTRITHLLNGVDDDLDIVADYMTRQTAAPNLRHGITTNLDLVDALLEDTDDPGTEICLQAIRKQLAAALTMAETNQARWMVDVERLLGSVRETVASMGEGPCNHGLVCDLPFGHLGPHNTVCKTPGGWSSVCELPQGHTGKHRHGNFTWDDSSDAKFRAAMSNGRYGRLD